MKVSDVIAVGWSVSCPQPGICCGKCKRQDDHGKDDALLPEPVKRIDDEYRDGNAYKQPSHGKANEPRQECRN